MSNFSWHEDEKLGWGQPPEPVPEPLPRRPAWRRLLLAALLVIALGTGATAVYRQLSQRAAAISSALEEEVRSSHSLLVQAAQQQDGELLATLLSGRDLDWAEAQQLLAQEGLYYDRPGFGLTWLADETTTAVAVADAAITLNPELNTAVLVTTQLYAVAIGNGLTQTVALQQTAVYRPGPDRWLMTSPDAEFWGEALTIQTARLKLTYPERDAAVARRLAIDLDDKMAEACRLIVECPPDLRLTLNLTTNPEALYTANRRPYAQSEESISAPFAGQYTLPLLPLASASLNLPAPTLVGMPQDEAAYRALARGYAARLLSAYMAQHLGWRCCQQAEFFQAALDWQLAQVGLRPSPLRAADYGAALGMSMAQAYEAGMNGDRRFLHMLVAFWQNPLAVQQRLVNAPQVDWQDWLIWEGGRRYASLAELEQAWQSYIIAQAAK